LKNLSFSDSENLDEFFDHAKRHACTEETWENHRWGRIARESLKEALF